MFLKEAEEDYTWRSERVVMNLGILDWAIVLFVVVFTTLLAKSTQKYNKSVADYLAANRAAGRYVLSIAQGIAGASVFTILGAFEMYYKAGFSINWWFWMTLPIATVITTSGWIIYRFRETRVLTLAQFFEIRYSRSFRIFSGILCFVSGVINFAIFPAVGARFFVYFCGLPAELMIWGMAIPTFSLIMFVLLFIAVMYIFFGGHITVVITDFFQGMFANVGFIILIIYFICKFDWSVIVDTLAAAPAGQSMMNPFDTSQVSDFNLWFVLIGILHSLYNHMSWQQQQSYNTSAKSAHEAKMANTLGRWRTISLYLMWMLMPICAYVVMHNSGYSDVAGEVNNQLAQIDNDQLQKQLVVSVVLGKILPTGLVGIFCAIMFVVFISSCDTVLHSWSSIFIQDVVIPFRKKPFAPKQHMWILKLAVVGVAAFTFLYSLLFRQTQYLQMYAALTATIFLGGAGSVIIGGLYWKKGSTPGAWSAMIVGAVLGVTGMLLEQLWPQFHDGQLFPVNGQWIYGIAMICSIVSYILVSLLTSKGEFNLDKMLHRGRYRQDKEIMLDPAAHQVWWKRVLGFSSEFSKGDYVIYYSLFIWSFGWFFIFIIGTAYHFIFVLSPEFWSKFWQFNVWMSFILGFFVTIWFLIGGIVDVRRLYRTLGSMQRDDLDDGRVVNHHNANEKE